MWDPAGRAYELELRECPVPVLDGEGSRDTLEAPEGHRGP